MRESGGGFLQVLSWTFYLLICLLAVVLGTLSGYVSKSPLLWNELKRNLGFAPPNPFKHQDDLVILLLGCDENRKDGSGKVLSQWARTDTIHLVRLDFKNEAMGMLDIPRDTLVDVADHHDVKINSLHVYGGSELTQQAVEGITGVQIDRVVVLDYSVVRKMVDKVGGVEIYVPRKMEYHDRAGDLHISLKPGWQTLNGEDAIGFVRFRRDTVTARGRRQQDFLVAFKDRVAKKPEALDQIANMFLDMVRSSLSTDEVSELMHFSQKVSGSRIKQGTLPGEWVNRGASYRVEVDKVPEALIESGIVNAPSRSAAHR